MLFNKLNDITNEPLAFGDDIVFIYRNEAFFKHFLVLGDEVLRPYQQLLCRKWLHDVVVGTQLKSFDFRGHHGFGGQKNDRYKFGGWVVFKLE